MDKIDERIFDRNRYSAQVVRDLDIMSVYFVDIIYNYLYDEAKKLKIDGKSTSVTEGYKHALDAFLNALSNSPKLYRKALSGIHEKFLEYGSQALTFSQCMNRITKNFIPEDYYASLNDDKKMSILKLVINQAVKNLIIKIVKLYIIKIIDYHGETSNVNLLKEDLIDMFLYERMGVYERFLSKKTKTNQTSGVSDAILERMQKEIKRLIHEKVELEKKNAQAGKALRVRIQQVQQLSQALTKTRSEFAELKLQNEQLDAEYNQMRSSSTSEISQPEPVAEPVYQPEPMPTIIIQKETSQRRPTKKSTIQPTASTIPTESIVSTTSTTSTMSDQSSLPTVSTTSDQYEPPVTEEVYDAPTEEEITIPQRNSPQTIRDDLGDSISLDTFI